MVGPMHPCGFDLSFLNPFFLDIPVLPCLHYTKTKW
uniref:Uncharacterized protein n=1 Tax=Arundo donax TaxID=35708 RepID=A0A0A8ZJI1_ARUDO